MQPNTINITPPSEASHDILAFVALVAIGVSVLVHVIVAVAVMNDSVVIHRRGVRLMFFGSLGWTFLALMTGLFGLVAYWLMHHSAFRAAIQEGREDKSYAEHVA